MEAISTLVKVSVPRYLQELPIPNTLGGFASLSVSDYLSLGLFTALTAGAVYASLHLLREVVPWGRGKQATPINSKVKKDNPKVVDLVEIEDLDPEKITYCRCWKSEKFPLCDGSHNAHNEETGDNVGPLVLKRKQKN